MTTVDSKNFKSEVLDAEVPVICDFWASWCGPCRAMKPVLEGMSNDEAYKVVGVDVDESNDLAVEYDINAIPTILVFKNGVVAERLQGLQQKDRLLEAVR